MYYKNAVIYKGTTTPGNDKIAGVPRGASPWRSPRRGPRRAVGDASLASIFTTAVFLIILLCAAAPLPLRADVIRVDKIAATVDDEIITLTDVEKYIRFFPIIRKAGETDEKFYRRALEDLVHFKVIYLEYREDFVLREEDYEEMQTSVIKKVGSYDQLIRELRMYDMKWADFKAFIREKVVYEKVMIKNFQEKITVNFKEIEAFYKEQYLPGQESLKLKPRTLIEMTPLIEAQLRKDRADATLGDWLKELSAAYKIEYKLSPEGSRVQPGLWRVAAGAGSKEKNAGKENQNTAESGGQSNKQDKQEKQDKQKKQDNQDRQDEQKEIQQQ